MNTATMLHRTAMEFYDLAGIYKAKGQSEFFDDYQTRAWLLEKEAALQMLTQREDYTFKYLVIASAGRLGYHVGSYEEAKKILELGLLGNPSIAEKYQMETLLNQIIEKINTPTQSKLNVLTISGTLTVADIENNKIKIRENGKKRLRSITVETEMIKNVLRFYLGEWVTIQLDKDASGDFHLKNINRA